MNPKPSGSPIGVRGLNLIKRLQAMQIRMNMKIVDIAQAAFESVEFNVKRNFKN